MLYLAYFTFTFALIQFIVVIINSLFNQQPKSDNEHYNKLVSILIPARNEEYNIANLLTDLQIQDYKNIEIIVFNDLSTDRTEAVISELKKNDQRIQLINSKGLPETWLGKNYACHRLALLAKGEYLLFIDADVRIRNGIISNSISLAQKNKAALLSIFPKQKMDSFGEYLTVPIMNYILLTLLPLVLVLKSKFPSMAAANGQFMLFESRKYIESLPHEKFKNNRVEDIEIARYYKQKQYPVICILGNDMIECRMYNGFEDALIGFSKNIISFFGDSFLAALLFWFITTFGCLIVLSKLSMVLFYLYLSIVLATKIIVSLISKQNIFLNLLLFVPQQLTLGILICKTAIYKFNKQLKWKGRTI